MITLEDLQGDGSEYVRTAAGKLLAGEKVTGNETRRISRKLGLSPGEKIVVPPLKKQFFTVGEIPRQIADRIHTLQEGKNPTAFNYTFSGCVSGAAKSFDIDITRGPY